jgi:excisionase family DNA binding protein
MHAREGPPSNPPTVAAAMASSEALEILYDEARRDPLLTSAEVATLFRVSPKTVTRWARVGKLAAVRTMGGHRRYRLSDVQRSLAEATDVAATNER